MPGVASDSSGGALTPASSGSQSAALYPLHHGLKSPISRLSISWSRGNCLRVAMFRSETSGEDSGEEPGGKVLEVNLGGGDTEIKGVNWRRIAYGSVAPFALLQSRKNALSSFSTMPMISSTACYMRTVPGYESAFKGDNATRLDWKFAAGQRNLSHLIAEKLGWECILEYSKEIKSVLGNQKLAPPRTIDDPKMVVEQVDEPTCLKAAWELLEIFYVDKPSQAYLPEKLVDWLADFDCLFYRTRATVHSKLMDFQTELVSIQIVEDEPKYWEIMSSALAVGWLDIVVKMLRLHGSYQLDQLSKRETENGLVEAVAVLVLQMPRMCLEIREGKIGECYKAKPDFVKAWERWRGQISKLDASAFWFQCAHRQTREGLRNMLQIMLGNANHLCDATCNWLELYVSHLLYIRPYTVGLESMYSLAQKCMMLKPMTTSHKLMGLIIGILGENIQVILAECSKGFGPWMVVHAIELLTAGSDQAEHILHEERQNLGEISMEELHRLVYAELLSSHALTWQIAPIYLTSCMKQGMGLLEILLSKQPVEHNQLLLKNLEMCRLYELNSITSNIMKIAGVHHWKHGRKGAGVFWLQQAQDEIRLNRIARQLFDSVGKSLSDESFKQWEGLITLLGSEFQTGGSLEFLCKYRDFKKSLALVSDGRSVTAARQAVESLILLVKNPSTPQRFLLPLMYDSLKLLNWGEGPLLNVSQTNLLLNKLEELSSARLRPDYTETELPAGALRSVRLALGTNLGRAILEE